MFKIKLNKTDRKLFSSKLSGHRADTQQRELKDRRQNAILNDWEAALSGGYSLIHTIGPDRGLTSRSRNVVSPFCREPVNKVMAGWDIISTSVIHYPKYRNDDERSGRGCLHVHLELDVPVQNIIGTHTYDVGFLNHVGRAGCSPRGAVLFPWMLAGELNKTIEDDEVPFNNLVAFNNFKGNLSRHAWSEVLVVGRRGVNTYTGYPPTENVKLKGIHYSPIEIYNALVDDGLKRRAEQYAAFLRTLMTLNQVPYFNFTLAHKRTSCKAIDWLYDVLVSEFGRPQSGNRFYLYGR